MKLETPHVVSYNLKLHRFAVVTAVAGLVLIGLGGLVTSKGAGMAVPDWPTSFGYNMFFLPISRWVGGIFQEHTHRLFASGVGLLTTILALWLYGTRTRRLMRWGGLLLVVLGGATASARPQRWTDALVLGAVGLAAFGASFTWPACQPSAKWLRRLGLLAFVLVLTQGVLGGLRVVLFKDEIGIFHAALGQLFFVLLCAIALFTSRWWQSSAGVSPASLQTGDYPSQPLPSLSGLQPRKFSGLPYLCTFLIFGQLVLGAVMRHQHAGLAIPDFPLAYGRLWPATDSDSVARYNAQRMETTAVNAITGGQVIMQMAHRAVALVIWSAVGVFAWSSRRRFGASDPVSRLGLTWFGMVCIQALLGAATIWSNKAADIATAHVVVGALCLALGSLTCILLAKQPATAPRNFPSARPVGPLLLSTAEHRG